MWVYMRVDKQRWQPWANTVAYYEFDWNLNDSSGNDRNMSLYAWTVTYWTTTWGKKYAYFNSSTWTNQIQIPINWDFTVLMWVNPQTDFGNSWTHSMLDIQTDQSHWYLRWLNTVVISQGTDIYTQLYTESRYLLANSYDSTNNQLLKYIDGNYKWTGSNTWILGNQKMKLNQIWDTNSTTYSNNAYYSELIIEDKAWTEQEILDYYDQTKSLYGIS